MDHKELRRKINEARKSEVVLGLSEPSTKRKVRGGLSSGSLMLNMALSGNPLVGYVWGRLIEIYGPETSGKTTLALQAVFEAQRLEAVSKKPVPCLIVDAEHALDPSYAKSIGIDLGNLSISQPDCGEEGLEVVESGIKAGYKVLVVDSVAALTPRAEIEGEMGDSHMGLQARLMSQACRKLVGLCAKSEAVILFINQVRDKIGLVFGNPETTTGGRALRFYASYRLEVRAPRKGARKGKQRLGFETEAEEDVELGIQTEITVKKNKVYPPYRKASVFIEYGKGIDRQQDVVDFLLYTGQFQKIKGSKGAVFRCLRKKRAYSPGNLLDVLKSGDETVLGDVSDAVRRIVVGGL